MLSIEGCYQSHADRVNKADHSGGTEAGTDSFEIACSDILCTVGGNGCAETDRSFRTISR